MANSHLVFVYGTLMHGEHHHDELEGAEFLGSRETRAEFDLVQIEYFPALIRGGSTSVLGELYAVNDEILARLDALEEVPEYYLRETIELSDGTLSDTYVMPRERAGAAPSIRGGSFRTRSSSP